MENNINISRRKFLTFKSKSKVKLADLETPVDQKAVKMLTQDGKLVEVPLQLLEEVGRKSKATHRQIMDWIKKQE